MQRNKQADQQQRGRHEHPLPQEISQKEREQAANAHEQAEEDMENDLELSSQSPNDDLDEGETARWARIKQILFRRSQ